MISALLRFSIRHYGIVIALSLLLLVYGIYRYTHAGLDIFPEFSPKQVVIQTESPGLSPEQVEIRVTQPIERALNGLIGLHALRSESIQGLSIVTALFSEQSDIYRNRQQINERLTGLANRLPPGIATPTAVPLSSSSATVLTIGLRSEHTTPMQLRTLVDWTLVPRLLAVPGVADVNVFGGAIKQLQVQLDPIQLRRFNLSLDEVIQATRNAVTNQGGGFLETPNQRFTLRIDQPTTPDQLGKIIVRGKLTLADIATLSYAPAPAISAAQIQGKAGIVMMVIGQYGANTLEVSRRVEAVLDEFAPILKKQQIQLYSHLFRPADYIETSLANLSGHLLLGGLFVLLVLYAFLFNLRTALISAIAIPLSLISAVLILLENGINLNIMILGGLAIALGEVVDDAIIDTENILRRLRENRLSAHPKPSRQVIYQASLEVRSSVVYASFIVALVFVPLLTLDGVAGRLFAPLGYAYILAILMSLLVALTLTPALCYILLGQSRRLMQEPPLIRFLQPFYQALLSQTTHHLKPILLIGGVLIGLSLFAAQRLGSQFLPELREGHYIVHTASLPGTSLQESIRMGTKISQQFLQIPGVASVSQWAGRAERGADTYGSHYSEYEVRLQPLSGKEQQRILLALRKTLEDFPGIVYEANTFLTERIDETISGYTAPIVVNIYGDDLTMLDDKARQIAAIMHTIAGATGIQLRSPPSAPLLHIRIDWDRLAYRGLQPGQIVHALQTAYSGHIIGQIQQGNRVHDIAITLAPEHKTHPEAIGQLTLKNSAGTRIQLDQVADISYSEGRYNVLHQGGQRKQTVTCNVSGRDLESFMQELKQRVLHDVEFPATLYPEFTGAAIEQQKARQALILHSLMALTGVLMFIYIAIGNSRHVALTLLNLPFALIGGLWVVLFNGVPLSVGSIVGFITLFGITVRNSIMLLAHYRHLVESEGKPWNRHTAFLGARQRLPSILMTALVTALAMLPIALNSDNPGREIMGPMAAIIIGGLFSSTALNLLLLPGVLLKWGRFQTGES